MDPIRYAGVVAFIDWISRVHPEVGSLRETPKKDFLALAVEYEASKGHRIEQEHQEYQKWVSTHLVFTVSASDEEALQRLR